MWEVQDLSGAAKVNLMPAADRKFQLLDLHLMPLHVCGPHPLRSVKLFSVHYETVEGLP